MNALPHCLALVAVTLIARPARSDEPAAVKPKVEKVGEPETAIGTEPVPLFDGKTLDGWIVSNFGGEGEVAVDDGWWGRRILVEDGVDLSGIKTDRKLPRVDYQVDLDAMRVRGGDFFVGLTFPVKDDPCSLIVGGWGGGVCGLSSIDGLDASENATTTYRGFESNRWYHVRLRVTAKRIQAWLDDEQIVDQDIEGKKVSIRSEVALSKPFGLATWRTAAAFRNITIRKLTKKELAEIAKAAEED